LDLCVAARLAKLIVEEYNIRRQKKKLLSKTKEDGGVGFIEDLISDLN
jgi:hypothetical protein